MTNMAQEQSGGDVGATGKTMAVVLAGVITSALALLGVWWLDANTKDWHIMGWYGDYVIPAGALIVGFASGSGYGIASYLTGLRIRRGLLWSVLALQLGAYVAAQYLEFSALMRAHPMVEEDGAPLSFPRYYHLTAINFAWDDHGRTGAPLGMWGYVFVGLGVLGFVAGGVLAPAVLIKAPYCDRCRLYMKRRRLALVPASAKARRIAKKDAAGLAAHTEENERAVATAQAVLERVAAHAAQGDARAIQSELAPYPPRGAEARRANKLLRRLQVGLVHCRNCGDGYLQPTFLSGQGHGIRAEHLARTDVTPDVAHVLAG
jgi:hypothetical protein